MPRVFISSSSLDAEFVEREIVSPLKRHGLEVWYSKESIETAAEWEKRIRHGLNACEWFLVVLSPRSVASDWVQSEVDWALEKRKEKVVPVLYEDCDPEDLHLKLRRIQYIDFHHDRESARRKLLAIWGLNYVPEFGSPGPPGRVVFGRVESPDGAFAVDSDVAEGAGRARRGPGGVAFWAVLAAAVVLLGLASAYAFFKMQGGPEGNINGSSVAEATPSPAASPAQPSAAAGVEIIPVEPVTISKIETYELVKGRESTFRLRMLVDNAPKKMQIELGERPALITGNRKMAGGENRREVLADVSFAREVALMKRRPDAPMPLLVKVSDEEDPANYEVQELEVDPSELGLEGAGKVAARRPVTVASGKAHRVGGTNKTRKKPPDENE